MSFINYYNYVLNNNIHFELINPVLLGNLYSKLCLILINNNNYDVIKYININYVNNDTYYYICCKSIIYDELLLKYVSYNKLNNINEYYNICFNAVIKNGFSLEYVINIFSYTKYLKLCLYAVKNNGIAIKFIHEKFKTYNICFNAVNEDAFALLFIKNQNYKICFHAVSQNGLILEYVHPKLHSYELYNIAVSNNGISLKHVLNQNYKLCYNAINTYNNNTTLYIPNQHPFRYIDFNILSDDEIFKLSLLSIKKDPRIIIYFNKDIDNLSLINKNRLINFNKSKLFYLYKKSIFNNNSCIKYIIPEHQTIHLCLLCLKNDIHNLKLIHNKSEKLYIKIVKKNGLYLEYLNYQTDDICYHAIINNLNAFKFVKNITYNLCTKLIDNNYNIIKYIKELNNDLLIDLLVYLFI